MSAFVIGILGIALLFVLLVSGVHIAITLGVVGMLGIILIVGFQPGMWMVISVGFNLAANVFFVVLPLFILMGGLAGASGTSTNIYNGLRIWIGRVRAGLGITTMVSCAAFGVITASSMVCTAVFAKVSAPEMRHQGYGKSLAYAICASGGAIGMLIPPSGLMVIYGLLSGVSIGQLLIAGISPGLLLTVVFSLGIIIMSYVNPESFGNSASIPKATWREKIISLRLLWPVLVIGAIIIGGIFGGVFTATEAAAIGAFVVLVLSLASTGKDRWKVLSNSLLETISITAMIFFIIVGAGLFARFMMLSGITSRLLDFVIGAGLPPLGFVLMVTVVYLVMGCFLDSISMLSITLPTIIPVTQALHIEPIWFAMVSIMAIEIGLITPPVGLNVFAAKAVAEPDVTLEDIYRGIAPFFAMMMLCLILLIAFPVLSTALPNMMFGS